MYYAHGCTQGWEIQGRAGVSSGEGLRGGSLLAPRNLISECVRHRKIPEIHKSQNNLADFIKVEKLSTLKKLCKQRN